jgi:hypothetical protein
MPDCKHHCKLMAGTEDHCRLAMTFTGSGTRRGESAVLANPKIAVRGHRPARSIKSGGDGLQRLKSWRACLSQFGNNGRTRDLTAETLTNIAQVTQHPQHD